MMEQVDVVGLKFLYDAACKTSNFKGISVPTAQPDPTNCLPPRRASPVLDLALSALALAVIDFIPC
jgi:hypothetical protein